MLNPSWMQVRLSRFIVTVATTRGYRLPTSSARETSAVHPRQTLSGYEKGGPEEPPFRPQVLQDTHEIAFEAYFSSTVPPASSICFLIFSASSLLTPSLTGLGAPSTSAFASPRPRPVIARTSLITLIFLPPSPVRMTSNSVFSSSAGAAAPPPAAGAAATAAAA